MNVISDEGTRIVCLPLYIEGSKCHVQCSDKWAITALKPLANEYLLV